jgi:hypothetical protein
MKKQKIEVWTIGKLGPFQIVGFPEFPLVTTVPAEGPFDIGKGYKAYLVTAPNMTTFVVESQSKAVVGSTIEQVKRDMMGAEDPQSQIDSAISWRKTRKDSVVAPEEFWTRLKCNV